MNNHLLFVLVSAAVVASVNSALVVGQTKTLRNSVFLSEPYEIVSKQEGKTLFSVLGNIPSRNCGGAGRSLQYRSEGCTTSSLGGNCLFPAGRNFKAELSFIPSTKTESLSVRTIITSPDGEKAAWENPFVSKDESIEAGREYTFRTTGGLAPELRGKMITSQLEIYRESDKTIEACVVADILVV